ncbi:uncharacterized protein LOC109716354 [Ananas comosus]|uniref:Uncharacterized protein LOC109716354 n=1 Tax=Ananas comosus TaxID=4615 RepID=A0A199VL26_ANACO|nr:uncharacterized protein LOC109716354 [Ananas comosus]OAY77581.1 hypothetical protein ACMD2_07309 [Ananas comosus]
MASSVILSFRPPVPIRASAAAGGDRRSEVRGRSGGGGKWWAPLFGWTAEPDYIDGGAAAEKETGAAEAAPARGRTRRYAAFTEEKARELRMRMMEMESFHDPMYHSAIASRLATDLPRRSGP